MNNAELIIKLQEEQEEVVYWRNANDDARYELRKIKALLDDPEVKEAVELAKGVRHFNLWWDEMKRSEQYEVSKKIAKVLLRMAGEEER